MASLFEPTGTTSNSSNNLGFFAPFELGWWRKGACFVGQQLASPQAKKTDGLKVEMPGGDLMDMEHLEHGGTSVTISSHNPE